MLRALSQSSLGRALGAQTFAVTILQKRIFAQNLLLPLASRQQQQHAPMDAQPLSRAIALALGPTTPTHSAPSLGPSRHSEKQRLPGAATTPHSMAPLARHLTRAVGALQAVGALEGAGAEAGMRAVAGLHTSSPFARAARRPCAPLAAPSARPPPPAPATRGAPCAATPARKHPLAGARAGLHSAFVLAEGEDGGEGEGKGQRGGRWDGQGQGQGLGSKAERTLDPWLTSAADNEEFKNSPERSPSPGSSSLRAGPGSGARGGLASLPASELKRLLDMGGVSYRYANYTFRPPIVIKPLHSLLMSSPSRTVDSSSNYSTVSHCTVGSCCA